MLKNATPTIIAARADMNLPFEEAVPLLLLPAVVEASSDAPLLLLGLSAVGSWGESSPSMSWKASGPGAVELPASAHDKAATMEPVPLSSGHCLSHSSWHFVSSEYPVVKLSSHDDEVPSVVELVHEQVHTSAPWA